MKNFCTFVKESKENFGDVLTLTMKGDWFHMKDNYLKYLLKFKELKEKIITKFDSFLNESQKK